MNNHKLCSKRVKMMRAVVQSAMLVVLCALWGSTFAQPNAGKVKIVATFFPIYLFTENITAGIDNISVDNLLPSQYGCPHDFALSPDDLRKIDQADIIVQNGLGMENFLQEAFDLGRRNIRLITATEGVTPIELKYYDARDVDERTKATPYNPHVFASPQQAMTMVQNIAAKLAEYIPGDADRIRANAARYLEKLGTLSATFKDSLKTMTNDRIVTMHEVFDYMARDFHFEIAGIIEKEPGQEPSAKEMLEMKDSFMRNKSAALFSEPQYSDKIVKVLSDETRIPVYQLDPVASGPQGAPLDYYETVMYSNLDTLVKAMKRK